MNKKDTLMPLGQDLHHMPKPDLVDIPESRHPGVFWSYYDGAGATVGRAATDQGSYGRQSPDPWQGLPINRHIDSREVLELGSWTSLSKGPRRQE